MTKKAKILTIASSIAILAIVGGAFAFYFYRSPAIPVPQELNIVQPRETKKQVPLSLYNGTYVESNGNVIRVRLDRSSVIAGFSSDQSTEVFHLDKSNGFGLKKMSIADVKPNARVSISAIRVAGSEILFARQIIFE